MTGSSRRPGNPGRPLPFEPMKPSELSDAMLMQENQLKNFTPVKRSIAASPSWIDELRGRAIDRFNAVGFPSNKQEGWRHTNVGPLSRVPFVPAEWNVSASGQELQPFSFRNEAIAEVVFINGIFAPDLSDLKQLPRGVRITSLAAELKSGGDAIRKQLGSIADISANPFVALNTANLSDGAVIHLEKGAAVSRPIHLVMLHLPDRAQPRAAHPRVLVVAEDNVDATIVETYAGSGAGTWLTNAVTEFVIGNNSRVDHCRIQQETLASHHISTTQVKLGRSSTYISHAASLGALLARNDLNVVLDGEGAEATLNGLVIIGGEQHCDNHTLLDHAQPNCPSYELYKHVLDDKASGVFRGKILVRPGAQKTDSKQTSRSLLLSDDADMNSQPALEIYADDVKCTHGSTIGPVDEEMIFYFRSRGVSLEAARSLLTYAFAADITRRIRVEPVRRVLENFMAAKHDLPQDLRITDLGRHDEKHR